LIDRRVAVYDDFLKWSVAVGKPLSNPQQILSQLLLNSYVGADASVDK
jgi:hypothetical protein